MKPRSRFRGLSLFVTVGSTKFDELINEILSDDIIDKILRLGFTKIVLQVGKSDYDQDQIIRLTRKIDIEVFDYKDNIKDHIEASDLVIGHAGAGTCLEVLRSNRPLLVIINERLMDNHQNELADQLVQDRYVIKSFVKDLSINLDLICEASTKLEKFPSENKSRFEEIFDEALSKVLSRL